MLSIWTCLNIVAWEGVTVTYCRCISITMLLNAHAFLYTANHYLKHLVVGKNYLEREFASFAAMFYF